MKAAFLLAFAIAACTLPADARVQRREPKLPRDVQTFVDRRDRCDHFRGEESDDPARATEIGRHLTQLCTGTDAELARLKRTHARNRVVTRHLARYDAQVE